MPPGIDSPRANSMARETLPPPPLTWGDPSNPTNAVEHLQKIAEAINSILRGRMNNLKSVTLEANADSTTISDPRIGARTIVWMQPTSANAAAEKASGLFQVYPNTTKGEAVFSHTNNGQIDRTFVALFFG